VGSEDEKKDAEEDLEGAISSSQYLGLFHVGLIAFRRLRKSSSLWKDEKCEVASLSPTST